MAPEPPSQPPGLSPPGQGPIGEFKSREREEDRLTRKPMDSWDRLKFLILLSVVWFFFVLAELGDNPIISFREAFDQQLRAKWWLLALIVLEGLRQIHYAICERSAAYNQFWKQRVFGTLQNRTGKMNDWTRYRIGRVLKILLALVLLDLVVAALFHESPALAFIKLPYRLFQALPIIFQLFFAVLFVIIQFGAIFWFLSRGGVDVYYPDDIKTRFSDVWGQDAVLARVRESIVFLEDPESIETRGGYVPGGILLWGPPGTGKTLMAEAVAGETGKPYVFVDPGAFINMFIGIGVLKVKVLFRKLRKLAVRYGGVIVFFDEADSLGNRGQLSQGGVFGATPSLPTPVCNGLSYVEPTTAGLVFRQGLADGAEPVAPGRVRDRFYMGAGMGGGGMGTLQALLTELSGLKKPRGFFNRIVRRWLGMRPKPPPRYRILVMMATNMPEALDEALLRPGRIDRIYKVGYPSKEGRIRTYEGYLAKVRHELTAQDIDKLATVTPYATGATMKDLVNEALIYAIRNGRDVITWHDVMKAKQLKELGPPEDVEYIERERHAVAVHEACHAVAAYRVRHHLTIDIATIEKGDSYLGMVASVKPEDQFTMWRSEFESDIIVSIASLVGERMFFDGDSSAGVSGDLQSATRIAGMMDGFWGMGGTVTSHGPMRKSPAMGGGGDEKVWDLVARKDLSDSVERTLGDLYDRTHRLLDENRTQILAVAHALETHKTLTGDDVMAIIDGRPGPLIDGSVYARPEFRRIAEEYHARVLAAHQGHRQVDVPLPSLNGHNPIHQPFQRPAEAGDPVEVELTEAELAGRGLRPPHPPPPASAEGESGGDGAEGQVGDGDGRGDGDGEGHADGDGRGAGPAPS